MVRLVYSNRTEELLAELATRIRAQQAREGALVPVRLVVPSAGVDAYLRLGIARECGIAANLESARLTGFAADMVAALSGMPGVPGPAVAPSAASGAGARVPAVPVSAVRVADAAAIESMALDLLLDDAALAHPELASVRAYLRGGGDADDPMDIRRVQLASRLGRLFEEYTYSRGELLAAWPRGPQLGERHAETEVWQRRVWLAIFGAGGVAARRAAPDAPRIVPLSEAVASLVPERLPKDALPSAVHVFGFAHVARTFHELFERLSRVTEVVVYSLSPCEGFWEDPDPRDPAPLHLWGRAGRDQVRALNAIAGFDHDDRFIDPLVASAGAGATGATGATGAEGRRSPTLLQAMQSDVLHREPARDTVDPRHRFERDESLVVLQHASVRRELEAVASEIWRLVKADDTLRFDEIAVTLPDEGSAPYVAQLPAVFREAFALPHRMSGITPPAIEGGSLVEAVHLLLSLPLGRFTRHELLRLVVHPAVVASLDDVDPTRWTAWCDALGVVHGADRTDHADTYIERDILNWDQGLRRLALGTFMVGDANGAQPPFVVGDDAYIPHDITGSELRDAAAFGLLVRSLLADARFARDAKLTLPQWAAFLRTMVETYLAPRGNAEEEELARCLRRLHGVGDAGPADVPVRYRIAREVAVRRVASAPGGPGGEGVVVSTIASLRPVPFRVVFACGLGEGQFPSSEGEDPLDLRWARRREGDVSGRERDKFAFLELLLSTRDRLYASYVSRDPLSGEALEPSSVVQELLYAVERGYVRDGARLHRRHPLRRWDAKYFPQLFAANAPEPGPLGTMHLPEAEREARTLALRRSLDALGGLAGPGRLGGARLDADAITERAASEPAWQALASHLGLVSLPPIAAFPDGRLAVPMYALVKFLEFPLQGWARYRLHLDEREDEDVMAREDEPFETDIRRETLFLRDVLFEAGARQCSLEEAYDAAVRDRELRGSGPSGVFAEGERGPHLETLAAWRDELLTQGESAAALSVYRFGRAGEHARADQVFDPVVLDLDVVDHGVTRVLRVEVGGRTLPMGVDAASSITLAKRPKDKRDDPWAEADRQRTGLRAFVDHAILSASGVADGKAHASLIVTRTPEGPVSERVTFRPLSRDEAVVWLRGIVRELLAESHPYFFPCEAVFAHASRDPDGPVTRWIEDARERLGDAEGALAVRSAYGPVPRPHLYPAPDEARARALVERRFAAFLRHRDPGEVRS